MPESEADAPLVIVDYGMGNLQSISNAFEVVAEPARVVDSPSDLEGAKAVVVPGVGAFPDGINKLEQEGFVEPLERLVLDDGVPFLGVCLGMQFLAAESEEYGTRPGLGWIPGTVERIVPSDSSIRIPHMGWNPTQVIRDDGLYADLGREPTFYYVHSYQLKVDESVDDVVTATTSHGTTITASVRKDNVFGVQFHPEKSQAAGLKLLENFVDYVNDSDR